MRRASDLQWPLLTCLLASAILAEVPGQRTEPTRDRPTEGEKQAVGDDDYQVLEMVLLDLIDFKEFTPLVDDGKKTDIVLSEKTAGSTGTMGSSGFLSDDQLRGESHDKKPYLIPADIRADLRRRNPKEPVSLRGFKPSRTKILLRDLSGLKRFGEFERKHPDARGYVEAWLPGYSKDGQTAVLRAWFGPTSHGATATYMLANKKGRWAIVWRKVAYYA